MRPLRILITIQTLAGRPGGSLYVYDLAVGLLRHGHMPIVYSTMHGELARGLRLLTIPVIEKLEALSAKPDIIDGNAPIETMAALLHFPNTPAIFVCHGWMSVDAMPPKFPRILQYLAVDETTQDRLLCEEGIPEERVQLQYNSVDLARFTPRAPLPAEPRRALIFSNNASEKTHVPVIKQACGRLGIELDVVGQASGQPCSRPETILGKYDLVFAKGRCALEALAVGTAVVVCDAQGLGQMVTLQELARLRRQNFGWRSLQQPLDPDLLVGEIKRYDSNDAARVSERVRATEGLDARINSRLSIYTRVIREYQQLPQPDADDEIRATACYLESMAPSSNTFYYAEQKIYLEEQAARIEEEMQTFAVASEIPRLEPKDLKRVRFSVGTVPRAAKAGGSLTIDVELENHSTRILSRYGRFPLRFSYHWLDAVTSEPIVYEGRRTEIVPPLEPDSTRSYQVACAVPIRKGAYILRLALVQESVRWFDQDMPDRAKDFPVLVI